MDGARLATSVELPSKAVAAVAVAVAVMVVMAELLVVVMEEATEVEVETVAMEAMEVLLLPLLFLRQRPPQPLLPRPRSLLLLRDPLDFLRRAIGPARHAVT